jgi:hypothetical protein
MPPSVDPFITSHFIKGAAVQNKSNQSMYRCWHCQTELEHHRNNCFNHLAKDCRVELDQNVCVQAYGKIMAKGGITAAGPLLPGTQNSNTSDASTLALMAVKKRKLDGNLIDFGMDLPLSPERQAEAALAWLR